MEDKKVLILLSDTDPLLARVYKAKFQKNDGWDATITASYEEAKSIIDEKKPSLVLSDIILDKGNGIQLLKDIRGSADPEIAKTMVVILTDLADEKDRDEAMDLGATAYMVKSSVSMPEVIDQVKKLIAA